MSVRECTSVTPECPVQATTLGYYPNRPLNIVIAVLFGVAAVIALALGIRKKSWSYTSFLVAGCVLELAGRWDFTFYHLHPHLEEENEASLGSNARHAPRF